MSGKVTDRDRGAQALRERLRALSQSKRRVRVGVLADAPKQGEASASTSLMDVALAHEFGAPQAGIPQRSFIRAGVDERRVEIDRLVRVLAVRVAKGQSAEEQALDLLGAKVAAWCQARIVAGIAPPLAESTLARKGGKTTPLILTGQLKSSITWQVVD